MGGKILFWVLVVFVLAAVPIGLHLAVVLGTRKLADLPLDELSDAYLYTFIIAMTAFTDTLVDERKLADKRNLMVTAVIVALVAALGYPVALVPYVMSGPLGKWLTLGVWPLAIVFMVAYCIYKIPVLYGAGRTDWEQAEERRILGTKDA